MKKNIILLIGTALFLTACSNNFPSNNSSPSDNSSMEVQKQSDANVQTGNDEASGDVSVQGQNAGTGLQEITGSADLDISDCSRSQNAAVQKKVLIKLADIKDSNKYKKAREDAVKLINECYNVIIDEEYEENPGVVRQQEGSFKYKIIDTDSIFDKLVFYPIMNVFDYDGFIGTQSVKYITNSSRDEIINFYKDSKINGFKQVPSDDENKLIWTDIDTTNQVLSVKVVPHGNDNIIEYDFVQPLAQ